MQFLYGGVYHFTHCTIASYSNLYATHKEPVVAITDAININNSIQTAPLEAIFINTICWGISGSVDNEVVSYRQGTTPYSVSFSNGLWRMAAADNITATNMLNDTDPAFENVEGSPNTYNFRLKDRSPALDLGQTTNLGVDLDGKPRINGIPDLGAFEKQ